MYFLCEKNIITVSTKKKHYHFFSIMSTTTKTTVTALPSWLPLCYIHSLLFRQYRECQYHKHCLYICWHHHIIFLLILVLMLSVTLFLYYVYYFNFYCKFSFLFFSSPSSDYVFANYRKTQPFFGPSTHAVIFCRCLASTT